MTVAVDDVLFATIRELGTGLRARTFSAVELTRAYCDRLEKIGARYNALALSLQESALERAEQVDRELRAGRDVSPLQGIPYAVKDLIAVAGHPTTWGSPAFETQVFSEDARVVELLDRAQAVLIGKTSMLELAGAGHAGNPAASLTGPALNPWNPSRWAGGSSSGSAIAPAAGLAGFAIGSDTIGSIMVPSALCGVTGFRPSHGSVSLDGVMPLSASLDVLGPMCRSAEDCRLVMDVIGAERGADQPGRAVRTIGYSSHVFESVMPGAGDVFAQAVDAVRALGVELLEVELPELPYLQTVRAIDHAESATALEKFIGSPQIDRMVDAQQAAGLKAWRDVPATAYVRALRDRSDVQRAFSELFARVDAVLAPTMNCVAWPIDRKFDPPKGPPPSVQKGLRCLIPAACLAGLPQLSLPCGFVDGLPLAISFTGPSGGDDRILALGEIFQRETSWHRRRPAEA